MLIILITFVAMEGIAWLMHKYIMHGFAWSLHKDHHQKEDQDSFFEMNDWFFVFFAVLSICSFSVWSLYGYSFFLNVGVGICVYGFAYFVIHEIFIHQRIKMFRNTNNRYLKAIRRAHKIHHKHLEKEDGECFGMLWVPMKYFKREFSK